MNKKGFTLIELLVVVLIIGILAAIALPQYRKAVAKAELAQVISATKAIQNAQERFYLAYNDYTTNLQSLDIDWPNNTVTCKLTNDSLGGYSTCYNNNFIILHYYYYQNTNKSNTTECYGKTEQMVTACESWTGKTAQSSTNYVCSWLLKVPTCWAVFGAKMPM